MMQELLYIVSRERSDLYDLLQRSFADVPWVRVILDRRFGERRAPRGATEEERRRSERRQRDVSRALDSLGWALVRA